MADVTGPISSLPGHRHPVPDGTKCDAHEDRIAVARVQGETDSFGSELIDMCQECVDQHEHRMRHFTNPGPCELCKQDVEKRFHWRDFEEGTRGPVYEVCAPCIKRRTALLEDEF